MSRIISTMLFLSIGGLFNCGGNSKPPVITIEKLQSEDVKVEMMQVTVLPRGVTPEDVASGKMSVPHKPPDIRHGKKITWRLKAYPLPKTDLLVKLEGLWWERGLNDNNQQILDYDRSVWVMIAKSKDHSETFTNTIYFKSIKISPLPTVYIVGKGLVLDEPIYLHKETHGGHRIPEDFVPPMYQVGEPSEIPCEDCGSHEEWIKNLLDEHLPKGR